MRKRKLRTDYRHKSDEQLVPFADGIVTSLTKNKYFVDGATLVADVEAKANALDQFFKGYPHPTPEQTALKNQLIEQLLKALRLLAITCNVRYAEEAYDEAALLSTGLEMEAERRAARDKNLPAPADFKLADGPNEGSLRVSCRRPEGAVIVLWRYTTDPNLPEDAWKFQLGGNEVVLDGFASGTRVYVKAAGARIGQTDYTYTPVLSRVVQ